MGVLSERLPLKAAANGKAYSLWVLSDLNGALRFRQPMAAN